MHTFWKKKNKKEQAQQPSSLHGRSDTPNSWKEKKKKQMSLTVLWFSMEEACQKLSNAEYL